MPMRRTTLILMLFLLAVPAATQLFPAQAQASRNQESLFQDDAGLVFTTAAKRDRTLDEMQSLGVDVIRLNVIWNKYAPSPQKKTRPSFDPTDPNAYPALSEVDAVVNGAAARGIAVQLTPTVPGPAWAS